MSAFLVHSGVVEFEDADQGDFCDLGSQHYSVRFHVGIVVSLRRVGPIWETWCCELGQTHADEGAALDWAFELSKAGPFQ